MTPRDRVIHTVSEIRQKALSIHNQAQNPEPDWDRIARDFGSIRAKAEIAARDARSEVQRTAVIAEALKVVKPL